MYLFLCCMMLKSLFWLQMLYLIPFKLQSIRTVIVFILKKGSNHSFKKIWPNASFLKNTLHSVSNFLWFFVLTVKRKLLVKHSVSSLCKRPSCHMSSDSRNVLWLDIWAVSCAWWQPRCNISNLGWSECIFLNCSQEYF